MKEIYSLIYTDFQRYKGFYPQGRKGVLQVLKYLLTGNNHCFAYLFWMRLASKPNLFCKLAKRRTRFFKRNYGFDIPPPTNIGKGFYIGHGIGIVIHPKTVIGKNCNVSQFLTIGANDGAPAEIGDNVYIGPNVCIVENVKIGSNVTIGAGSVVVKDIPDNATVAGVPAKVLNFNNPGRYINNRVE